jgi:CDGSH-type Zn-finger protein
MAEFTNEERNGHIRTTVVIAPNERVKLCRCYKSKEFPFCDGIHKNYEDELGPVIVTVKLDQKTEQPPQ